MHTETIAIGSELLLGEIIDTNSAAIAKKLQTIGMPLHYTSTVGDDIGRMVAAIRQGLARSDVVITTGGLGPTVDDLTRQAMAEAIGRPLVFDEGSLAQIEERFRRFGRVMSENNRRQAYRPEGSTPIENPVGTAPCFIVEHQGHVALCLPGVPREMEHLMDHAVLPFLRERFKLDGIIKSRVLKIAGAGESVVDERIGDLEKLSNPAVGLNAHSGVVVIRITASAVSEEAADRLVAPVESIVRERLGGLVFGADGDTLEGLVLGELARRGQTLGVVESGTGGRLAKKLAKAEQAKRVFCGGRVLDLANAADGNDLAWLAAQQAGTDWGLACALASFGGELRLEVGVWNKDSGEHWQRGFGGHPALAPEWSANLALEALRRVLLS